MLQDEEALEFLGIDPKGKSPYELEREWFEHHYHGNVPQLTLRAVAVGMVLGAVMSLSNLYIGLKTGWGLGVAITACVLSYSIGALLEKTGILKSNLTILENNCMQSTASSAGYSTGAGLVSGVAALVMIRGVHLPFWTLLIWTIFLAILGVVMAVPMKRQMINVEQLRFPSGIAAAETLRSLYASGKEGVRKARGLGIAGLLGGMVAFCRENAFPWWPAFLKLPSMLEFPGTLAGHRLIQWTISFEMSLIMIAAGAIIGFRVAWSMLLGGLLNYAWLAPLMVEKGVIRELGYRSIVSWSLWGGTAVMVTSGLLQFALQWRTIGRAIAELTQIFRRKAAPQNDPLDQAMAGIEVPDAWFLSGTAIAAVGVVWIQVISFGIPWWMGLFSVLMTFFLAVVACRATGETDITPIGAMGKITQLLYGILAPSNMTTNLMTATVTAGAASSAADLLTDLKSGYLLGANPRKQFLAQFLGIFAGALVIVPSFYLLVPSPDVLGGETFPAPSAQVWKGVAELLSAGLGSLHATAKWALLVGGVVGIVLPILERILPERARVFVPSPMGLGIAFVIPFWNTLSMFIGASVAWAVARREEPSAGYIIPVASGIIAGESILGVVLALMRALGIMG